MLNEKYGRIQIDKEEVDNVLENLFDDWGVNDVEQIADLCDDLASYISKWGENYGWRNFGM